ncbi:hypothetical protein DM01DRAFT_1338769 [Hesseltinella vesiculosa]|uniref:SAP domain-containing protein n=1 Tax=Hesseltinella vesiculosa TaxID=101127 RepID=A0A1X2G9E0_9FUNG|nr:hypothetical protein DM01DRAFT_1338769 [Hesseltinella vesiculosa]
MDIEAIKKMRVVDLREELGKRNLAKTGKKDELVARLIEAMASDNNDQPTSATADVAVDQLPPPAEATPSVDQPPADKPEQDAQQPSALPAEISNDATAANIQPSTDAASKKRKLEEEPHQDKRAKQAPAADVVKDAPSVPTQEPVKEAPKEAPKESSDEPVKESPKDTSKETADATPSAPVAPENLQALCIKGLVRPLINKTLRTHLEQFGTLKRIWIDPIKTHSYVVYDTSEMASLATKGLDGTQYPPETGGTITAVPLSELQAEQLIEVEQKVAEQHGRANWEKLLENVLNNIPINDAPLSPPTSKRRIGGLDQISKQLQSRQGPTSALASDTMEENRSSVFNRLSVSGKPTDVVEPKPLEKSLDDLFLKTKTTPHLYYMPVDEAIAKERLEARQRK